MEKENLTKLTKGTLQVKSSLPVPIKNWCCGDFDTISTDVQFKICRYVGTSCRVIGTTESFANALMNLKFWRDWYKSDEIFLVRCIVELCKLGY